MSCQRCFLIMLSVLFLPLAIAQDKVQELTLRIEELEKTQEELLISTSKPLPQVNSFFKDKLTLGGFFEPSYTFIAGPDTELQAGSNSHFFGLNFAADFTKQVRFVSQFVSILSAPLSNEHNDPRAPDISASLSKRREYSSFIFASIVAQGYAEYIFNSQLRVQAGLGYVPFGYYAQLREPVLFIRRGGPQSLRTSNLFMPLWMGLNFVGMLAEYNAGYNVYTAPSVNESQKPGMGARVWKSSPDDHYTFGLSTQIGKKKSESYEVLGADLNIELDTVKVVTEYIIQITEGPDPWSISISPSIPIFEQEVLLYTFVDYANATLNETGSRDTAIPDPYSKWEYGLGLNWLPTTYTRYRVGLTFYDYVGSRATIHGQNRDYTSLDFSVGVAF
jgi:hypothetical protein